MALKDVMHTSNPIYEYAFSWTIDNFSKASLNVRGPSFSPIPGYSETFCFQMKFVNATHSYSNSSSYLHVELIHLNAREISWFLIGNITLRNMDKILMEKTITSTRVTQNVSLNYWGRYYPDRGSLSDFGLEDSKLIMEGTLAFSGYNVTTSIYSPSVQQSLKNCGELSKDFKTMYESGLGSDVTFSVGDKKLPAHKTILLGRSPVFAKMFEHDMLENNTNNVTIEDVNPHVFNCFLMFLYTDVVEDDKYETVISLYSVAEKYQVKSLQKACFVLLVNQISVECVCSVLMLADLHADEELKNVVKIFIRDNFFDIAGTAKWAELLTIKPTLADEVLNYMKSLHKR